MSSKVSLSSSRIMAELAEPPAIVVAGERLPIERLPLRKIFQLVRLIQEGFGDLLDFVQGNLPPEVLARIAEIEDPAEAQRIVQTYMASTDMSLNGQAQRLLQKEDVFFAVLALALGRDADWVADHVTLDQGMRALACLIEQELTADFFGGVMSLRTVWSEAKGRLSPSMDETSLPTASAGSGSSSPNSVPSGPISATPVLS